jgi:hypothetical protein
MITPRQTRTEAPAWTGAVLLPAVLLMALGAWVFLAPLAGPYVHFGFDTGGKWRFSQDHWILGLIPGAVIFAGGLVMTRHSRAAGWLGGLLAVAGGVWLVIGPSLHPIWSDGAFAPLPGAAARTALRWIAFFYGAGALAVYLGAQAQGLLERRPATVAADMPAPRPAMATPVRADTADDDVLTRT